MTRLLPVLIGLFLLAGCVAVPYNSGGGWYPPAQPGYGAPPPDYATVPPAPPPSVYLTPGPYFQPGWGFIEIDPLPRFCCGFGWQRYHYYHYGDRRWHYGWRRH